MVGGCGGLLASRLRRTGTLVKMNCEPPSMLTPKFTNPEERSTGGMNHVVLVEPVAYLLVSVLGTPLSTK